MNPNLSAVLVAAKNVVRQDQFVPTNVIAPPLAAAIRDLAAALAAVEAVAVPQADTVRVRIAVAVDSRGNWEACGWGNEHTRAAASGSDDFFRERAMACVGCLKSFAWLEADVPLPTETTVEGTVTVLLDSEGGEGA